MLYKDIKDYTDFLEKHSKIASPYVDDEISFHERAIEILKDASKDDYGPMDDGWDMRPNRLGGCIIKSSSVTEFVNNVYFLKDVKVTHFIPSEDRLKIVFELPWSKNSFQLQYYFDLFDEANKDEEDYMSLLLLHKINDTLNINYCRINDLIRYIEEMKISEIEA
jgi:hypothetical protein